MLGCLQIWEDGMPDAVRILTASGTWKLTELPIPMRLVPAPVADQAAAILRAAGYPEYAESLEKTDWQPDDVIVS